MSADTVVIVCDCDVCEGLSARVRVGPDGSVTKNATRIHNLVRMAHFHPWRNKSQMQRQGPWAI